jgi:NCS1 family nucleobase:cation symporter-1
MVLTRASFCYLGTFLPAALSWVACIGWFAVNTILGVLALQQLLHVPYIVAVVVMVAGQVVLAVCGYNLIHSYERWMTYVLGALFLVATVLTLVKLGSTHGIKIVTGGFHPAMFVRLTAAALGYAISWTPCGADYSRYMSAQTAERRVFSLTFLAGFVSAVWLEALGALIAAMALTHSANPVTQLVGIMGIFGGPMLIAIILGTGTANAINIYSGALSALVMNVPLKRWVSAIVIGVLGTALLLAAGTNPLKLEEHYTNFLLVLVYWISPWLAIMLTDFYLFRKGRYVTAELYRRGEIRWAGLIALAAALYRLPPPCRSHRDAAARRQAGSRTAGRRRCSPASRRRQSASDRAASNSVPGSESKRATLTVSPLAALLATMSCHPATTHLPPARGTRCW